MSAADQRLISFATSGSTGRPQNWWRTEAQLALEAEVMGALVPQADAFLSFAAPQHLFGKVFGSYIPRRRGVACYQVEDMVAPVAFPDVAALLIVCVPSTWSILPRYVDRLARYDALKLVHGAGPLPTAADQVLARLSGTELVEIFGSTETGGIATRRRTLEQVGGAREDWETVPDIEILAPLLGSTPKQVEGLVIGSPRLASPTPDETRRCHATGDIVNRSGARSFVFLGRSDRTIKVDGRRINLDAIDSEFSQIVAKKVASVPVEDPLRGTHFDVFIEGGTPQDADAIRGSIRNHPRMIRLCNCIPNTASGKTDFQKLAQNAHNRVL